MKKEFIYKILLLLIFLPGCFSSQQLPHYINKNNPVKSVKLDKDLKEISGLAVSNDGRLFAHNDEKGEVFQIDTQNGKIIKKFKLGGKKKVKEDFEGIAIVNDDFYMVTSGGDIYKFKEGSNKGDVDYDVFKTGLKSKYDVEGLCYDPETNALLLACKEFAGKKYDDERAVYSFSLDKNKMGNKPRFLISIDKIESIKGVHEFKPSAIERNPVTGSFFIVGGKGFVVIEISKEGKILSYMELNRHIHAQPEGIAFLPDNTMLISDEAVSSDALLSFYRYTKK